MLARPLLLILLLVPIAFAGRLPKDLLKAAKKGDANAQFTVGSAYADAYRVERDYAQAVEWLEKAAAQDHDKAQEFLGKLYYTGLGVEKDHPTAVKWLTMSSELGNPQAQELLANMYRDGEGVAQDHKKAAYWYRMAAEQGFARAQFNLGVSYNNGEGVEQDHSWALCWITRAADDPPQNYEAEYTWVRDDLNRSLPPEIVERSQTLCDGWQPKSWDDIEDSEIASSAVAMSGPDAKR